MANNFHYAAASNRVFCHQAHGSDANDGLTPDTPKKTLNGARLVMSATRNELIISGHFKNQIYGALAGIITLIGDGLTIIEYQNNSSAIFSSSGNTLFLYNIKLQNISALASNVNINLVSCKLSNIYANPGTVTNGISSCVIYNCSIPITVSYNNCIIINSSVKLYSTNSNRNYFNRACLVELSNITSGYLGTYNNYECKFKYQSTYYDTLAVLVAAYPVLNDTEGNRADVITFNNTAKGDYTVPANSPLLNIALWGGYTCGNARKGKAHYWSDGLTGWTISQTNSTNDLELSGSELKLASGKTIGSITRNADSQFDIGTLSTLKYINLLGALNFVDGSGFAAAINSYVADEKGYNPVRMTIAIKYSAVSRTQAQWNEIDWTVLDISKEIKTDNAVGNGHPDYDYTLPAHLGGIKAQYFLLQLTFRTTV